MKKIFYSIIFLLICVEGYSQGTTTDTTNYLLSDSWDDYTDWNLTNEGSSTILLTNFEGLNSDGITAEYALPASGGWVNMSIPLESTFTETNSVAFFIKSSTTNNLEIKFIDKDGTVFRNLVSLDNYIAEWKQVVVYLSDLEYAWGGDSKFDDFSSFDLAVSGNGSGTVWLDEIGIGKEGLASTFPSTFDPDSTLAGIGFAQRRTSEMETEDPLILEYLKFMQDISSVDQQLLPAQEDDQAQTFNNSLVAISFIIKDEKTRAERILDFYANATNTNNTDIQLQNFYYNGEARGFYQWVSLETKRAPEGTVDRWIGDMAWLLIACKNYEKKYNSARYDNLVEIIKELLISFFKETTNGGYVQSGWRKGDSYLHKPTGHHEGNIDCYVAFKLCNEDYYAQKIKNWLLDELDGKTDLPIDLYTWRVLAFGSSNAHLLNVPEYDFRYRKIINIDGEDVMGFYHGPDISIDNFWNDATGHIACAYIAFGDSLRGYFYANQLDKVIIERVIGNDTTHTIPYTLNKTGGYDWVDQNKGFVSCVAWYIFAKNKYNPFLSENFTNTFWESVNENDDDTFLKIYPNPFSLNTTINYLIPRNCQAKIEIFDLKGVKIKTLLNKKVLKGQYELNWDGMDNSGKKSLSGSYIVKLSLDWHSETQQVLLIK